MRSPDSGDPSPKQPVLVKWLPTVKETLVPLGYFLSEQGEAKSSTAEMVKVKLDENLKARRDFLLRLAQESGIIPQGRFADPGAQVPFGAIFPLLIQAELSLAEEEAAEDIIQNVVDRFLNDNPSAEAEFADSDEFRDATLDEASRERRELIDHGEPAGDDRVTPYEVRDHLWAILLDAVFKRQSL